MSLLNTGDSPQLSEENMSDRAENESSSGCSTPDSDGNENELAPHLLDYEEEIHSGPSERPLSADSEVKVAKTIVCGPKLIELVQYFLPSVAMRIHNETTLKQFVTYSIGAWYKQELIIYMTCSQKIIPRIPVKVYEFIPCGKKLLEQIQYRNDPKTGQCAVVKQSPPLGMMQINHDDDKTYINYVSHIVDRHIDSFADICWADDVDEDFAPRLFKLMTLVKPRNDDECKLLREVFRLIVTTYIMSHTLTIAKETKEETLSKLHSYVSKDQYSDDFTSPRLISRQLKYSFARFQHTIFHTVLNKFQQIVDSSTGCDRWVVAFICVVGLCMALEDEQKTIHQVMATQAATENIDTRDAQILAESACREIDDRMNFIRQMFRRKYPHKCNPLKNPDHEWEKEVDFGDDTSASFVRSVAQLVQENSEYLQLRQIISISSLNQAKYTGRLISVFLLSFWLP